MLLRYHSISPYKRLFSSLRLKEVTDRSVAELTRITDGAKIALFLTDNESQSFKLLAFAGYAQPSLLELQFVPFSAPSLLSVLKEKLLPTSLARSATELPISASIMQREDSHLQLGLPLIASNVLVGALLLDFKYSVLPDQIDFLSNVAEIMAIAIANSILFGRSEYERERFSSLYRCSALLNNTSVDSQSVFQAVLDTASFLANTPSCALLLYQEEKDVFTLASFKGLAPESFSQYNLMGKGTIAGSTLKLEKVEYLVDSSQEAVNLPSAEGGASFNSLLALPLVHDETAVGVLQLFSTAFNAFGNDQIELLESLRIEASKALSLVLKTGEALQGSINENDTGLHSRSRFDQLLKREVEHAAKQKSETGLLLVGIDDVNMLNGRLAKSEGDDIPRQVIKIIGEALRDQDKLCHFASDRFAVILPETPHESVLQIAERLNTRVRKSKIGNTAIGEVTVSIGVATLPLHAKDIPGLLQVCEQALLVAKHQGGDKVVQPHASQSTGSDSTVWLDLVNRAKVALASKEQFQNKSQLTPAADYAGWLTKDPVLVEGETSEK